MTRSLTPENQTLARPGWNWQDIMLVLAIVAISVMVIHTATEFRGVYDPHFQIETRLSALPEYTVRTLLRMGLAYGLSLGFSLIYAYTAYRSQVAARLMIPLLDILQSIPVLSFLPGVVLALIALFPGQWIGVELASIILIFTGMTWNMTFSFYQSLCSIPTELREAATVYKLNSWQRFWTLELPAGAIGLVWNSIMSVAGGWFFLIAIESFRLGDQDFRLPGLGAFLATAASQNNLGALAEGLLVLVGVIVATDFFVWQPLIAWAERFKVEMVEAQTIPESWLLDFLRRSPTLRILNQQLVKPLREGLDRRVITLFPVHSFAQPAAPSPIIRWLNWLFVSGLGFIVLWGTWEAVLLLRLLSWSDWHRVIAGAIFTTLRVMIALILSLAWTIPVGVAIGRNPKLARLVQPLVQMAASIPATALFPVLLLALIQVGGGLQIGSIALMMLGTMWYLLFNIIAGAQSIPSDLLEAAIVYRLSPWQRWQTVILPGIFPYLVTGIITAVGGAWNASIVSEYVTFGNKVVSAEGLGATISQATASGNFSLLLAATIVMSLLVVMTNRLVWHPLYRLAQEKYKLLL
ncbi:ABC transporter permease [Leptolyngbya sp. 'hensonii']|uniref:ABC transporter permease n=1 Tax=Leptolyngbya sp. 'hensonii' TaxID=1922337 RepID=UPI000950087B|nr:ABC transporter permease subunit [Leptolyngbya sp. 'hensonii']OLP16899.1 ABC transporter permease [Leptolyngbya sp. 'hensonii']